MADVNEDLTTAISALQDAQTQLASQEPTLADNVLAAVLPVLTAAGYTAPADPTTDTSDTNTTTEETNVPVSTEGQ
jgi:hypothetical protein